MSRVNTDQKLRLVQNIRMQNQYNRMKCRERENFLYGNPMKNPIGSFRGNDNRELYSTEAALSFPMEEEMQAPSQKTGLFTGFRIRFLIAVLLLGAFIYLDKNDISILGRNTFEIFVAITESIDLPVDIPGLD